MSRLFKRGTIWWMSVSVPGQPRIRRSTGKYYKEAAAIVLKATEIELANSLLERREPYLEPPTTLADARQQFADHMAETCKPKAWKNYPSRLRTLVGHLGENYPVGQVTERDIGDVLKFLKGNRKRHSASTHNSDLGTLRRFFGWCAEAPRRWIHTNPVAAFAKQRVNRKPVHPLNEQEIRLALSSSAGTELELPMALGLMAGLRLSEMANLRWENVNLEARSLTLGVSERWSPKNRESKPHPIPDELVELLTLAWNAQQAEWVCVSATGVQWNESTLSNRMGQHLRGRGIDASTHTLRHTYITILLVMGVDIKTVQVLARHKHISTTLGIYAHTIPQRTRDAIGTLSFRALPVHRPGRPTRPEETRQSPGVPANGDEGP